MLKILSILTGGLQILRRPCLLYIALIAIQQSSYIIAFFLLQGLMAISASFSAQQFLWTGIICILALAYCVLNRTFLLLTYTTTYAISAALRLRLCNHMQTLSIAFFKKRDKGELSTALLDHIKMLEAVFAAYFYDLATCIIFPALLFIIMLCFSWPIALVLLLSAFCALPLLFLACRVVMMQGQNFVTIRNTAFSSLMDYVGGIRELKAANITGERFIPLQKTWNTYQKANIRMESQVGLLGLAYCGMIDMALLATLFTGMWLVESGTASIAVFMFFMIVAFRFVDSMQQMAIILPEIRKGIIAGTTLFDILSTPALPLLKAETRHGHAVRFENVSFAYNEEQVLKNVSFSMPEGNFTALVGHSGSGKSTIAHLLLRFWDIQKGTIRMGGADIRSIPQEELYKQFSVVFQDVYLFDDTVFNNILMARPTASEKEVMEAARKACCHDFIESLENGYYARIGEGGAHLSGGEKQRISIARAILKDAPLVILDEATASLDPENELHIQEGLTALLQGKTLLVIAHRLETIRSADSIIVLSNGSIVEQGRHDDLIAKEAMYANLWQHQNKVKSWQLIPENVIIATV